MIDRTRFIIGDIEFIIGDTQLMIDRTRFIIGDTQLMIDSFPGKAWERGERGDEEIPY